MSEFNVYENIFSIDRNLLHRTWQKCIRPHAGSRRYIKEVEFAGEMSPYQRKTYFAGIGESVSLYCGAVVSFNDPITVLWSFNQSSLRLNGSFRNINTYIEDVSKERKISGDLDITFIEDTGFGICYFQNYQFSVEKVYLQHKMAATAYITRT